MRCFIAIEIPQDIKDRLWKVLEPKTKDFPELKWVQPHNWHITLKFLGEVKEENLKMIKDSLRTALKGFRPFEATLGSFGTFPGRGPLRVFWIGIKDGASTMTKIAESIERELTRLGFPREDRKFTPHLTLARTRRGKPSRITLEDFKLNTVSFPGFKLKEVVLFESKLRPEGPIYTKLEVFALREG